MRQLSYAVRKSYENYDAFNRNTGPGLQATTATELADLFTSLMNNGTGGKPTHVSAIRDQILSAVGDEWLLVSEIAAQMELYPGRASLYLQAMARAGYLQTRWVTVRAPSYKGKKGRLAQRTQYRRVQEISTVQQ